MDALPVYPHIVMANINQHGFGEHLQCVLTNISPTLHHDEHCTLAGTPDADKSTLFNIFGLLDEPSSGMFNIRHVQFSWHQCYWPRYPAEYKNRFNGIPIILIFMLSITKQHNHFCLYLL
ncbi:hypothetical protein PCO85_20080 [Prodigiosinella aquatilis]|nr:hypothetical protein [Prodigiosinella sp. LS101]WJV53428.1 hypothetical protein PCO85_20080 [Prodigiosinella sp. LS101]WJV57789.1 hypothetical protein PCO84_20060 [Pectobacteriaceae bacterium C111]